MFLEKVKEKIKDVNILPTLLFIVVLVNYLPIITLNFTTKASKVIGVVPMAISLFIECIILIGYYYKKVKIKKEMSYNFLILLGITVISLIIQVINFFNKELKILDLANIVCKFINILLLYILIMGVNIEEKYINNFMKAIVIMGLVACIQNLILYFDDILGHLGMIEATRKFYPCKSFFPQKNPFAFFLYVSIISTIFLLQKDSKIRDKVFLGGALIIFLFNLVLTFSRTGTAITILFLGLYFFATNKISKKTKFIIILLGVAAVIIAVCLLDQYNPELLKKLLRLETVKNFTGRTKFWDLSKEMLSESPINILFGVGRFKAATLIEKFGVTQFHNTYVEFLVSGGIVELIYCMSFYIIGLVKIIKSKMDRKYKSIYIPMILTFFAYMLFESLGRFSIGWSDTMCMIFFITIPLLHVNSCNEVKKISEGN
ncbi:MAG: O-antigen ligase family protein [Clostridia bacterium]|nr:O-antigen ligase family protein [Clostridia bacterium]